jgi:PilZ domain-containing protein
VSLKDWFKGPPPRRQRMGVRRAAPQIVVIHSCGATERKYPVKDISATGVYLLTQDRWASGTPVPLTLHHSCIEHEDFGNDITLPAQAVRCAQDGMGLSFDLPEDIDPLAWVNLVEGALGEAGPDDIVGQFKMAEATTFLSHICPDAERDFRQRICSDLSSGRFRNAIEIALKAKHILDGWTDRDGMRADPTLLTRILEYGSWAEENSTQQLWSGLLAIACAPEKDDETNLDLVERLSEFAAIHFRIFTAACARATKVLSDEGIVSAQPLVYTTDDVLKIVGSRDLGRVERDLQHLCDLGFFVSKNVPSSYVLVEELDLAPTSLGLKLYARFHAHRGPLETFYDLGAPIGANERRS